MSDQVLFKQHVSYTHVSVMKLVWTYEVLVHSGTSHVYTKWKCASCVCWGTCLNTWNVWASGNMFSIHEMEQAWTNNMSKHETSQAVTRSIWTHNAATHRAGKGKPCGVCMCVCVCACNFGSRSSRGGWVVVLFYQDKTWKTFSLPPALCPRSNVLFPAWNVTMCSASLVQELFVLLRTCLRLHLRFCCAHVCDCI